MAKWREHGRNYEGWEEWDLSDECKRYWKDGDSWQQIIIEGVTEIPEVTFGHCKNIKRVIFANTVIRIKEWAFSFCTNLVYIKLSINIEVIENAAFFNCDLSSVFLPPKCREIGKETFRSNENLGIFHVHSNVQLDKNTIARTKLMQESHFELDKWGGCRNTEDVNHWIKNINSDEKYFLHRVCSSFQPFKQDIHAIIQQQGLRSFDIKNGMNITPSRYLKENPFANVTEKDIIRDYILKMIGELE